MKSNTKKILIITLVIVIGLVSVSQLIKNRGGVNVQSVKRWSHKA